MIIGSLPASRVRLGSGALALLLPTTLALAVLVPPRLAHADCTNGDPADCNPPGATLNPAAAFVDPTPPPGAVQCAGFINTAANDVDWNWENNCLPFSGGPLFLRVYDMSDTIIAGAQLDNPVGCPWTADDQGYDTSLLEGAGFLGHAGVCDGGNATTFAWYGAPGSFCSCTAPDGLGSRTCNDIFTASAANDAVFYVGADSTSHAYEAVWGPPGGKNTCTLDVAQEIHELKIGVYVISPDADGDGVFNAVDNCPNDPNPLQEDMDADGLGDVCDPCPADPGNDDDGDGVCFAVDNCPDDANPMQDDSDADGVGDVCDPCPADPGNDPDGDMICALVDNCPMTFNPTQLDQDMDGIGAVCDVCPLDPDDDGDGDGLCANVDNCPEIDNPLQEDADMDDVGDACDACPGEDDAMADFDRDGVCATVDNCLGVANPDQTDTDGDGDGDDCDACPADAEDDADGDGLCADVDNCPDDPNPDQADEDGDGIGDVCDFGDASSSGGGDTTGADSTGGSAGGTGVEPGTSTTAGPNEGSTSGMPGTGADTNAGPLPLDTGCTCRADDGGRGLGSVAWWSLVLAGVWRRRRRASRAA